MVMTGQNAFDSATGVIQPAKDDHLITYPVTQILLFAVYGTHSSQYLPGVD